LIRSARRAVSLALGAAFCLSAGASAPTQDADSDSLLQGFRAPPDAARPQVWWHWISGNVSLQGAQLDLEWLQRVGIRGVHTFFGGGLGEPHVVIPPVEFMGAEWQRIFRAATLRARALGMEVTIAGSPGWSETGGPWVAPENAMKKYVWSEIQVHGGTAFTATLPAPPTASGPFLGVKAAAGRPSGQPVPDTYRDARVIAFPTPPNDRRVGASRYTSSAGVIDLASLASPDLSSSVDLPIAEGENSAWLQVTFDRPTTIAALTLGLRAVAGVDILAGDDAAHLRLITHASADSAEHPAPQQTYGFAATRAKMFRIVLTAPPPKAPLPDLPRFLARTPAPLRKFAISRCVLSGAARVNRFESKAGFQSTLDYDAPPTPPAGADAVVQADRVIDLTHELLPDGRLNWTPPPGEWTVLRFGWSLTGQTNGPADPQDTGLEVDKLDAQSVRDYLEHYLALYQRAMGRELGADSVQYLLTDSWEAGVQNWTVNLPEQFLARRGYDLVPYLPVLTGRVVSDAASSERFLWDFRRTLQELLADNHYGVLAEVLHAHGMSYYTEAQGDTPREIGDGMTIKSRSDIPTAEFWYRPFATAPGQPSLRADLIEAASAAHVYGKDLAAAESLTVAAGTDPWAYSPRMLKPVADEIFARGINRILLHESHHQPLIDKAPGLSLAFFGQFFNRNDTWAEQAGPWVDYLARTSYLLQQGRFCADIAYFYGEERNLTEINYRTFRDQVPAGYAFDYISPEALLNLLSAKDGLLATPSGMRYRVLYLPSYVTRLTLPTLRKLRDLVNAGAVLIARRPEARLGLEGSDAQLAAIVAELWDAGSKPLEPRHVGAGRVYASDDLAAALAAEGVTPDVSIAPRTVGDAVSAGTPDETILSLHRHAASADIYFLSNRENVTRNLVVTLRVKNKVPELWHAEDGTVESVAYQLNDSGVEISLQLPAQGAVFVVLRQAAPETPGRSPIMVESQLGALQGPWKVRFQADRGAPAMADFEQLSDWSQSTDPGVRYFSGRASYAKTLNVRREWLLSERRLILDLGDVHELAAVSVDGREVAVAWHPPYQVDMTSYLDAGPHQIEIAVVNLWANRLIGDKQPGATPVGFAPQSPYQADSSLLPSGLLGPVRLLARDPLR
jgi:hypothetical protein